MLDRSLGDKGFNDSGESEETSLALWRCGQLLGGVPKSCPSGCGKGGQAVFSCPRFPQPRHIHKAL
jgi:hypothetical protein